MHRPMDSPTLSVLLLTKNGGERFGQVLEALFACRGARQAEVILIDSGSSDQTLEIAARYPAIRRLDIPAGDFGHGRTRNLAARQARGDVLLFLVQDAVPAATDLIDLMLAPLIDDPSVAAVFARQEARADANPVERFYLASTYGEERQVRAPVPESGERTRIRSIFFSNVCSAIRREVWRAIPFDETLIMSEDQLWARQALAAGHRIVYEPTAVVEHSHNYRLAELFQRNFDSGYSLRGIISDSPLQMARYELSHLASGMRELIRRGQGWWLPYLLVYEAVRVAGFVCGGQAHRLPRPLRRRLSLHKYYWD